VTRTSAVLIALVLVVLAGCSSFGGVPTTRQPFDVEDTTATPSTTTEREDLPPVIAFDPVANTAPNAFDLVDAHYRHLDGRSYTVQYDRVQRYANGTTFSSDEWTTTFGPDRSRYVQDRRSTLGNWTIHRQLYSNGSAVWSWTRFNDTNDPIIRLLQSPRGEPVPPANVAVRATPSTLRSGLASTNVTGVRALDTVPSDVNEPVFLVTANETTTSNPFGDRTLSVSMLLIVTEEGRIVEYALETTFVEDGERFHAQTRVQFRGVGRVTVDRPAWVDENATTTNQTATYSSSDTATGTTVVEADDTRPGTESASARTESVSAGTESASARTGGTRSEASDSAIPSSRVEASTTPRSSTTWDARAVEARARFCSTDV